MAYNWKHIKRTQRAFPIEPGTRCMACGARTNIQRHHVDEDRGNNAPENIQFLCQTCHIGLHIMRGTWGRMKKAANDA